MREILFKGKDKDDGNWYEGYYLQLHDTTYCCLPSDSVEEANRLNKENEHHYIVFEQMTDWGLPNKHLRAEVLPETVCQYTGLTDENGRNIFEGDIVKATLLPYKKDRYSIGYIVFERGTFKVYITKSVHERVYTEYAGEDVKTYSIENNFLNRGYVLEVIGNIFDNPELLEVENEID